MGKKIMESNLIPSMKETLFDPTVSGMGSTLEEIAEIGLDSVLQDGVLKDFPILGTVSALCKTGINLRERNFVRQTAAFITTFNNGTISEEKLNNYRQELENDPKRAERELGRVILLLDRMIEDFQSRMLGRFYSAYVRGAISWDKFVEISEVNTRMFISDYRELDYISRTPIQQTDELSDNRLYKIQRLESLGLVKENRVRLHSGNKLTFENSNDRFVTTPLGGTLFSLMDRELSWYSYEKDS